MLFACVLIAWPAAVAGQFAVHPVQMDLEAVAGVATRTVTVENQSSEPLELRVYLSDFDRAAEGGHQYLSFGEHPSSCEGRLQVFPDQLTLAGNGREELRLRMQPDSTSCWGMVFVERRTLTPSGVTVAHRIGVKVYAEGTVTAREGRVLNMAVDTTPERAALVAFENPGHAILQVEGEIEVRSLAGEVVGVVELERLRVLPGRQRHIRVPITGVELEPGRYLLVAILDFGGDYLAGGQTLLQVEP